MENEVAPVGWENRPVADLVYPGDDVLGSRWERPPDDQVHVRGTLPGGRDPFVVVLGSSGFKASWQTGIMDVLEEIADPIRLDLASGGTVPGLAIAAGISRRWRRIVNAGVPSHKILRPLEGWNDLRWFERRNLDVAGFYDIREVESWLARWLAWAGVTTFRDLRYQPGEERPDMVAHRAGICVSMWRTKQAYPVKCTDEQLSDPMFIRRAFRWAFYGRQFPWRQFKQIWVPDTIGEHLPWLKNEIDDHSPAFWARVSMSQWPACLPMVLQDPQTLQLIFFADGGHIDNQPSLFNDGHIHRYPLINPRLMQHKWQGTDQQAKRDLRRMPFGKVVRFEVTPETNLGPLDGNDLTWAQRDVMWRRGVTQGRQQLPAAVAQAATRHRLLHEWPNEHPGKLHIEVPALHGFQAIAATRRTGTRKVFGFRS